MERTHCKCYRCRSEDNLSAKCTKPTKYNEKQKNQVCSREKDYHATKKEFKNGDNDNDQNIYVSMVRMSDDDESPSRYFGDSSLLTNCILYSGATCNMTPQV